MQTLVMKTSGGYLWVSQSHLVSLTPPSNAVVRSGLSEPSAHDRMVPFVTQFKFPPM